jgi:serine/threonine protein kinase
MPDLVRFAVGGPVQVEDGTYLLRPADTELFQVCQAGDFAYVLASRQIGKSSLMFETATRLGKQGVRTALIDLNSIGKTGIKAENWYFSLIDELARRLDLKIKVQAWWDERPPLSTTPQRFLEFLRDVVLQQISESIVIFIDEIDDTLGLDFRDDFFAAIRYVYNERAQYSSFRRLTFVLLGVATPDELIKDHNRTPFNIGRAITLDDFTKKECAPFHLAIEARYSDPKYFDRIYDWTTGHPYLTQKLTQAVLEQADPGSPESVDKLVHELFLAPADRRDDNLQFVESRVMGDPETREMLNLYKRIRQGEDSIDEEQSPAVNRLKLYGLVKAKDGRFKIRNKIYEHAFDVAWANEMLAKSTRLALGLPKHYHILQEIDQGGFATIYLAETTLASGETKNVALKVLNLSAETEANSVNLIKRFEREAAAITRLDHPNIIRILETGRSETGRGDTLYIAMEYIAAGTVHKKLKDDGPLRKDVAVAIVRQIGAALAYAHQESIIHRDVKPANILLDDRQEPVRPVLTDFGLVKELSAKGSGSTTSAPLGTTRYMAPEQLAPQRWKQATATPATDIYALAITFFEMLAGKHPFDTDSDYELTDAELAARHLNDPLPALSKAAPDIGPIFDDILAKATAKNPAERFETIDQFVEAIETTNSESNRSRAARLVDVARDYSQAGDFGTALDMIERALEISPEFVDALRLKGEIKLKQGHILDTLANYRRAYDLEGDPASAAGQDYLDLLKRLASQAWQNGEDQSAIEYYRVIAQILNEGRATGASVQAWAEAWTELVTDHHQTGSQAFAKGDPENIEAAIQALERDMKALEVLQADQKRRDLVEMWTYLQVENHCRVADEAFADGHPDDIGGAIDVLVNKISILDSLGAEPKKAELEEKLRLLQVTHHWANGDQAYAAGDPEDIGAAITVLEEEIQSLEALGATSEAQALREKKKRLQIKNHYDQGLFAYEAGTPADLDGAIEILKTEIKALEALEAERECQDLDQKLRQLQISKHQLIIETAAAAITSKPDDKTIFHHYDSIDEAYRTLIELEPEHKQLIEDRKTKLKDQAEQRRRSGHLAERNHQYETALQHYTAIDDIEQTKKYKGIARILKLELTAKIAELEEKIAYDRKYKEIEKLIAKQEYANALNLLGEEFIKKGIYEHRDAARLLWGLVYAKQNDWNYPPPEWENEAQSKRLQNELAEVQQELSSANAELTRTQTELETGQGALAQAQQELQMIERRWDIRISLFFIIPSLIIGSIIGVLIGINASWLQNSFWLIVIIIVGMLLLFGLRVIAKRINE